MSDFEFKDASHLQQIFENDGFDPLTQKQFEFQDVLATSNAGPLLPKVIVQIIKEAQEPLLIGTSLLDRLPYKYGQTVVFPAMGAMVADDIPEGGEYPEHQPQLGGATVTANVGKVGIRSSRRTKRFCRFSSLPLPLVEVKYERSLYVSVIAILN